MSGVQKNPKFYEELRREPAVIDVVVQAAEETAEIANKLAHRIMPRRRRAPEIRVERTTTGARMVNTSHGGHIDEFGSAKNPPYSPLRRAVRAAGHDLREAPKSELS